MVLKTEIQTKNRKHDPKAVFRFFEVDQKEDKTVNRLQNIFNKY